jgi:aldehyde dehydrogenase (NAD+)
MSMERDGTEEKMNKYEYQYIAGEWKVGRGVEMEDRNPYTGEILYAYKSASKEDVDDAYAAAATAQRSWSNVSPADKQTLIEELRKVIAFHRDEIIDITISEGGGTHAKADFEYNSILEIICQSYSYPVMIEGKILPSNIPNKDNYVLKTPKGVIGVIAPWNMPIVLALRSVLPAVACGNGVVLKPSSDTPATGFLVGRFFEEAGFPKGLVNVVAGKGSDIGDYFVEHPIPSVISFTGSSEIGSRVGELAGKHIKEAALELGGNNALIVLDDANLDRAANAAVNGSFFHQGQICMAVNRIIVLNEIHDAFTEIFIDKVKKLTVGNPADPDNFIGPMINKSQQALSESYIRATIDAGATIALEGKTEGPCIHPWVFTDVKNAMPSAANEVFAPVASIIKAKDEDEAIRIANDTEYGLSGAVFTEDLYRGMRIAKRMETGMFHVNDQPANDEQQVMFGGVKKSGLGRFNARWVVDKFTTDRWISVQTAYRW